MTQALIKYEAACRAIADKDTFLAIGRASFVATPRSSCAVCGKHRALAHAHHVVPLAIQWSRGFARPRSDHVWLCPTHHAAVHVLIGQSLSKQVRASKACIAVVGDLADDGLEVLRTAMEIAGRAWQ